MLPKVTNSLRGSSRPEQIIRFYHGIGNGTRIVTIEGRPLRDFEGAISLLEKNPVQVITRKDLAPHVRRDEQGSTILQMVIVLAIALIATTFALLSIQSSKASLRLQTSVRQLGGYLEKARLDAVRRHGQSSVVFNSNTSYDVTMDFAGTGTVSTRTFPFEQDVAIISTPLPSLTFNWRGRTSACTQTFAVQNARGEQSWVDVSDAGDVTVNNNVDVLPTVSFATLDSSSGIQSSTIVTGGGVHNNALDCLGTSGSAGPPISGGGPGCIDTADPSSLSIRKAGGSSATISVHATNTGTVTVSKPLNLNISPATQTVTAGGTVNFTVSSNNNTRGTFAVNFGSPCATLTVLVSVTN